MLSVETASAEMTVVNCPPRAYPSARALLTTHSEKGRGRRGKEGRTSTPWWQLAAGAPRTRHAASGSRSRTPRAGRPPKSREPRALSVARSELTYTVRGEQGGQKTGAHTGKNVGGAYAC